jgi:hypothetical protein
VAGGDLDDDSLYRGKQPDGYERNDFNEIKKGERK